MAAGAALAALALSFPASATVLYSTNFASPTFTTGTLAGQDGWGVFPAPDNGTPTVQDTVTDNGEPAVDLGSRGAAYYLYGPVTPTGLITISMDIDYASPNDSSTFIFGAVSSSNVFSSTDNTKDLAAGIISGNGGLHALPLTSKNLTDSSLYTWHNLSMTLDYATQTYDVTIDGNLLASDVPFCGYEPDTNHCTGVEASQFEGIEVVQTNGLKSGGIYFGDVSISEVPEPTTWTLMFAGVALTGLALRRHARRLRAPAEPSGRLCAISGTVSAFHAPRPGASAVERLKSVGRPRPHLTDGFQSTQS
jgi:hypothetical protein